MLHAGLTGSIAVGKSFVLRVFAELGCYTADADMIAREVVRHGTPGLRAIVAAFEDAVLDEGGNLDRDALGKIIFNDEAKRLRLNRILHPLIINRQRALQSEWEQISPAGVSVVEAALIVETGGKQRFDKLVVVHCRPEIQLRRLMTRNATSEAEARRRIAAQMPQREKMLHADFTIDSSDGFDDTREQTMRVYNALKSLVMV